MIARVMAGAPLMTYVIVLKTLKEMQLGMAMIAPCAVVLCKCIFESWLGCIHLFVYRGKAWAGSVVNANDMHPLMTCSNKGTCDTKLGFCQCFPNFEGVACERAVCPNECSLNGVCYTQKQLAHAAGRTYSTPWDASKELGCVCDIGKRGVDCSLGTLSPVVYLCCNC